MPHDWERWRLEPVEIQGKLPFGTTTLVPQWGLSGDLCLKMCCYGKEDVSCGTNLRQLCHGGIMQPQWASLNLSNLI